MPIMSARNNQIMVKTRIAIFGDEVGRHRSTSTVNVCTAIAFDETSEAAWCKIQSTDQRPDKAVSKNNTGHIIVLTLKPHPHRPLVSRHLGDDEHLLIC